MPELDHPRREAFAQAWARGPNLGAAYASAGFSPIGGGGPNRIHRRADVRARMAELRVQHEGLHRADLEQTILALLDLATNGDQTTAGARKEARTARLDAHRLNGLLTQQREDASWRPPRQMTDEEWVAEYGHNALKAA